MRTDVEQCGEKCTPSVFVPTLPFAPSPFSSPFFNPHLNLSALRCREFSSSSSTSHSRPACQRPLRAEREQEDVLMNPLTEQRVHLSGNPIKSQGEMLLCLTLIIASLPCTVATALFLEVYWDGGALGVGGAGQTRAQRQGRRRPSHYAHRADALHRMCRIC